VFSRLREIRKALATDDGVPAYAIFTDEELAGISRLPELTESGMKTVPGIGEKKVARYGTLMIDHYQKGKMNETENHNKEENQP
jgi:superfamily II DNA helicase RecQ